MLAQTNIRYLAIIGVLFWAMAMLAATRPTKVDNVLGGKGHYVATLSDGDTNVAVSDAETVIAGGMTEHVFLVFGDTGTVTVTPWFGTYLYSGSTITDTKWVSGAAKAVTAGMADAAIYTDYPADLVRVTAESCSSGPTCDYEIGWVGWVK